MEKTKLCCDPFSNKQKHLKHLNQDIGINTIKKTILLITGDRERTESTMQVTQGRATQVW